MKPVEEKVLLDRWQPPPGAGAPIAVFAATFALEADFVDRDCLSRFLSVTGVDESTDGGTSRTVDDIVARIELEDLLGGVTVSVLADRSSVQARSTLRWDLLPCSVPNGLLHSKVAVLMWEHSTRVLIGSANLTSAGYRKQVEMMLSIDLGPECLLSRTDLIELADERAFEKTVVFCWYVKTGGRLETEIARRISEHVLDRGAREFGIDRSDEAAIRSRYENLARRLLASDTESRSNQSYQVIRAHILDTLRDHVGRESDYESVVQDIADVAIRNLRTDEFLSRCSRLGPDMTAEDVIGELTERRPGGDSLMERWIEFAKRLVQPGFAQARRALLEDLLGSVADESVADSVTERHAHTGRASLRTVRRAHGATGLEDRVRLTSIFNTPSVPDILVASSVMGEGIDLHMNCDTIIHHDLDWNPGVVEQRTGRIERIGSLAERRGTGITVYVPYLAGTHDEKMFRVVDDRRKWFDIVMGRDGGSSPDTSSEETRQPIPDSIVSAMALSLEA